MSDLTIPRRPLGRTGVQVSAIGLGGFHLGQVEDERAAHRIVHQAIDAGVDFMDNAWEYHDGASEQIMGRAIEGRREKVFLMTKVCTHGRGKKAALEQLEESLRRLKTDYLDLWQIHEVVYHNEPDMYFNGVETAIEAMEQARKEGKVRFLGFTGHKSPAIHLKMLSYNYPFDTCQLPLNCFDANFFSFEREVLPELNRRCIAPIGMKSLAGDGDPVKKGAVDAKQGLRYAMSLPVAVTVSGIDSLRVLEQNLSVARGFEPMSAGEMDDMRRKAAAFAGDGRFELYKTSMRHDGKIGREQHGFPQEEELAV